MRSLAIRFFILLSLLTPALASAVDCYVPGNWCQNYPTMTSCSFVKASTVQAVTSCSLVIAASSLIGTCTWPDNTHTYYESPYSLSTAMSWCTSGSAGATGIWTVGTASLTTYLLSVANAGKGSGRVTSSDNNINCGSSCNFSYNSVTNVTLTATPSSGSTFTGWSGACTGTGACTINMNAAESVTATFNLAPFTAVTTGVTNGIITTPTATVTTKVTINQSDLSKRELAFVTAWVPSGSLTNAQQASIASFTTLYMRPT